ncbi:cell wall-active antibiotics response protein LiaF [Bacillus sp. SG-1]|uniref:cell wall-active antibiotics response protein LiaF n=1 Tax=Bacillus sp. SG-1 TaxID=161544 RepID=UPI0002D77056|nr:cell wall-active antibiotics response protein LiaF [Bacillus sp. SG-1]
MKNSGGKQWFFSAILLMTGVVLLLINIGVISLEIKQLFVIFIPLLILLQGLKWMVNSIKWRRSIKFTFGLFLFIYGGLLILDTFDAVSFSYGEWWKLWPVSLMGFAFMVLWKKSQMTLPGEDSFDRETKGKKKTLKSEKKRVKVKRGYIVGDVKFNQPNWPLESMRLYNMIGNYYFDISKAYIPEGETPIHLKGWVGDVKMLIPEDIPVDIRVEGSVGDIKIFGQKSADIKPNLTYRSPGYDEAEKKLKIMIEFSIGSVRINKV